MIAQRPANKRHNRRTDYDKQAENQKYLEQREPARYRPLSHDLITSSLPAKISGNLQIRHVVLGSFLAIRAVGSNRE